MRNRCSFLRAEMLLHGKRKANDLLDPAQLKNFVASLIENIN